MHTQGHVRGGFGLFPHEDVPSPAIGSHSGPRCLLLEGEAAEQDEEVAREEHESRGGPQEQGEASADIGEGRCQEK